ncbi:hypothetical protein QFC21_006531 [Naganishia friedmannii]|uniref:Uncharacterized protein n=1 Tax=Naganishia friedmannii TaxID=89922 RepID=A0ACC2V139_9TREE|nr:hypothetical protein QFC21_006531 [Naganishia friedmannii]
MTLEYLLSLCPWRDWNFFWKDIPALRRAHKSKIEEWGGSVAGFLDESGTHLVIYDTKTLEEDPTIRDATPNIIWAYQENFKRSRAGLPEIEIVGRHWMDACIKEVDTVDVGPYRVDIEKGPEVESPDDEVYDESE